VLGFVPLIGGIFGEGINAVQWLGGVVYTLSKIYLIVKAIMGATTKIPIIGDVVWAQVNK
jgi:uncharacterized membrane protein